MSGMAEYTFSEWAQAFPFKDSEPLRSGSLSPGTCFIRVSTTSPLPAASHWETWEWTDRADELVGYTANVVLPDLIATWFFEQSEGDRLPSREYLRLARQHGSLGGDIPVVEDALDMLEAIDPAGAREETLQQLSRVSRVWNARFAGTGTWDLSFDILPDLESAATAFWDRYYEEHPPEINGAVISRQDWLSCCRDVTVNTEAHALLVESFSQDFF